VLTFQAGVSGYTGGRSVTISDLNASYSWNHGVGNTYRGAYEYPELTSCNTAALVRFDNLSIPAGRAVVSASLTVKLNTWYSGMRLVGSYLKAPWAPTSPYPNWINASATVKWNVPGASGIGVDTLPGSFQSGALRAVGDQVVTIALDPAVVAQWIASPGTNQGVRLVTDGTKAVWMYSDLNTNVASRPILTVTVQ